MRALIQSGAICDEVGLVEAMEASLSHGNQATVLVLLESFISINQAKVNHQGTSRLFRKLLFIATAYDLALTLEILLRIEHFLDFQDPKADSDYVTSPGPNYDSLFCLASIFCHHRIVDVFLKSHAKSRIRYSSFASAIKFAVSVGNRASFRCLHFLLPHIPQGENRPSKLLRYTIASNSEQKVVNLIARNAGLNADGSWVDDQALLMAFLHDFDLAVGMMQARGADMKLTSVLKDREIGRLVCEALYRGGARFSIGRLPQDHIRQPKHRNWYYIKHYGHFIRL